MASTDGRLKRDIVADELRARVEDGTYDPGTPLPTTDDLRAEFGATIATVQAAVQTLRREGLIDGGGQGRRPRISKRRPLITHSAAYVTADSAGKRGTWKQELAKIGLEGSQVLGRVGETTAPSEVAELLGVDEGEPVVVRQRTMLADGEAVQIADTYYPLDLASGTALAQQRAVSSSLVRELLEHRGDEVVGCREQLSFPRPDAEIRERLGVTADDQIVRLVRATCVDDDRAAYVDVATLRADRHTLCYELPV